MDGMRGYRGWRWIFILEGALTVCLSFLFFFTLPDFPEDARWLSDSERAYVQARLEADQGFSAFDRPISLRDVGSIFCDYKVIVGGFMLIGVAMPAYGFAYFAPTIIKSYGYSAIQTQLHTVPVWICAFVFAMVVATLSDKLRHRFMFAIAPICIAIAGFAILLVVHHNKHVEFAALFLVAMGGFSATPVIMCWCNMNIGGHHRRAVACAFQICFANFGAIVAVYSFLPKDAVHFYKTGYCISISFCCLSFMASVAYFAAIRFQNRNRDRSPTVGLSEHEKMMLGDLSPEYRYLL
jgi:predicted MFS family arabinose efflux permease